MSVYKTSRAVWRWIRSKTKLEARNTEHRNYTTKFTLSMDRLEIKVTFVIRSSISLRKENPVYPHVSSYIIYNTN